MLSRTLGNNNFIFFENILRSPKNARELVLLEFFDNVLELLDRGWLLSLVFAECYSDEVGALTFENLLRPAVGVDTHAISK